MHQLLYLISEAFRGWKANRLVMFPAFVTVFLCSALLCASVFAIRASFRLSEKEGAFYTVEAFLKTDAFETSNPSKTILQNAFRDSLFRELKREKWIESVEFISEEQALEIFRRDFSAEMLEFVEGNPLPASFRMRLAPRYWTPYILEDFVEQLKQNEAFETVQASVEWTKMLAKWKVKILIWPLLGGLFLLATLALIIGNAVRLSLYSRKILVENMKYTGASRFFIEFPFALEGLAQGLLGSAVAAFVVSAFFNALSLKFSLAAELFSGRFLPVAITVGTVSGLACLVSFRAVRVFLTGDRGADS